MKSAPLRVSALALAAAALTLGSCAPDVVQVRDANTGQPLGGAAVYRASDTHKTRTAFTDPSGTTVDPGEGAFHGDLTVAVPGYETRTIR